jgi:hypothetical protein
MQQEVIGTMFEFLPNDAGFIPVQICLLTADSTPAAIASTAAIPRC